ncbi:MAG: hypothetical protein WD048_01535 [Chitinophagales bacterium]
MKATKKFDAVKMMRKIREKLSEKYWKHPDILKKEMKAIREKHKFNVDVSKSN